MMRWIVVRLTGMVICIAALLLPLHAFAASQVPPPGPGGHVPPPGAPPVMQPLPEIKGVLSWNTLAKVKQIKSNNRIVPEFSRDVSELDNKEVTVQGFMMPLEPGEKQKHFLISINPQTCAFCIPAGPEGVVEVKSKTPIKYTFEPILLKGKMAVLKSDPMGLYYRLTDAMPASLK